MKTKNLIRKSLFVLLLIAIIFALFTRVLATESTDAETQKISLSDEKITINGEEIPGLESSVDSPAFLATTMINGGTSEEAQEANIKIDNIIEIRKAGVYEFSGTLTDGQISVNANNINGDVVILLNNANITCEDAPAIFVYNKETKSDTCNVIIKTAKDSENSISGGLIKQSVEGWEDQDKIEYNVEKGTNDKGEYYERYKYDGAISSDITLTFEGEGTLTIESQREGIESKRDITINSGNYVINSVEDGMNAAQDNESVITINGGTILVNVQKEDSEGDAIDSNGEIYINGGEIYAFASEESEDSGLDSDLGIYINGGTIVATGNMYDEIKSESKQKNVTLQFNKKLEEGTLITIVDKNNSPIMAFETNRDCKIITLSNSNLTGENYTVYEGGEIEGTKINGLYIEITSYKEGTKCDASIMNGKMGFKGERKMDDMQRPDMQGRPEDMSDRMNVEEYQNAIIALSAIIVFLLIIIIILIVKLNKEAN